jgi:hypothetical protein
MMVQSLLHYSVEVEELLLILLVVILDQGSSVLLADEQSLSRCD